LHGGDHRRPLCTVTHASPCFSTQGDGDLPELGTQPPGIEHDAALPR
jgi:hypothetical protein